jgi:Predicted membrane protein
MPTENKGTKEIYMREKKLRIIMAVAGVCTGGFSVGLFKTSLFGTDPFQCLMNGLNHILPIQFGTLYVIVNLILLAVIFFLDKHYIGLATCINIFLLGYIVDGTMDLMKWLFPSPSMLIRIILLVAGIVILCFASSVYFTANLGVSTYDAVSLILSDRKIAKFQYCRIGCDLICTLIGFLLGAVVGVGTLVTAFFMGPLIQFFNVHFSRPLLAQAKK